MKRIQEKVDVYFKKNINELKYKYWDYLAVLGIYLPTSVILGFYMYIGIFNRLLADDYCSIYFGRRLGLFRSVWYWYINWHGGFSASAADWLLSFIGPGLLPIMSIVTLVIWISLSAYAWSKVFLSESLFFYSLLLGNILIYSTFVISPDISQSFFWWGGARGYLLPLILITLYVSVYMIFISLSWKTWQLMLWYLASFSLVFFTGGFAEVFTPVQLVIFVCIILWGVLTQKKALNNTSFQFLFAGLIGAFLSLIVMVAAPGNSLRQDYFPAPPDIFTVLQISINGYVLYLRAIFSSFSLVSCVIGSMLTAVWVGIVSCGNSKFALQKAWQAFIIIILGFVLAFGCFPSAAYGLSDFPPPRTQIIPSYLLMIGILGGGFIFGQWLGVKLKQISLIVVSVSFLIMAIALVVLSVWSEFQFLMPVQQEHVSFAQKWDQTDSMIKNAIQVGAQEVHIPSMENWASLEYPTDNSKYWPNICYSIYYDIDVVALPLGDGQE